MEKLLSPDVLPLFLLFVVPGFVAMKVYDLMVPGEPRQFGQSVVEVVSFSMLNYAVLFWLIERLAEDEFRAGHPVWHGVGTFTVVFLAPLGLAIGARWLLTSKALRRIVVDPRPSPWDAFFGRRQDCWLLFHLKSGRKIGGFFGGESWASAFPGSQEVYVQEVWRVDERGRFVERVEQTAGAFVRRDDCHWVEVFQAEG